MAAILFSMISVLALRFLAPPTTAFMLRHWLIALTEGRDGPPLRYDWVDYECISRDAALAVVAAEDQLFPSLGLRLQGPLPRLGPQPEAPRAARVEAYEDLGRTLPANVRVVDTAQPLWLESVVTAS